MKTKTYNLPISRQIDVNFRNYALYVLENRGIPSFYDGLTNVQRVIIQNAPHTFNKTISLVGACISDGYHHGDKSLSGAINKLARPFGNSEQILLGDGFFGTPVNHEASAPRYTSVKINPKISDIIKKNQFLNQKNDEDGWNPLWVDLPIGLTTTIIGIAVGYKTTVLPRDLGDIQKYLDGKAKEIKPKFKGFTGKITRFKGLNKSWLIEGVSAVDETAKSIRITELPPLMKYGSFLKKVESFLEKYNISIINNSSTNVDIQLKLSGSSSEWVSFVEEVEKSIKMLVTETPVFVKDGRVIEYNRIEDYIEDYKYRLAELHVKRLQHFKDLADEELLFLIMKEKYFIYMLENKKNKMLTDKEVDDFLTELTKDYPNIKRRLESVYLKSLTDDELKRTQERIIVLKIELIQQKKDLEHAILVLEKMQDTAAERGTKNKINTEVNLFADQDELDGIEIFQGIDNEEEIESED